MSISNAFNPDWLSPPGDTIREVMAFRSVSFEALCNATGLSAASVDQLLVGELPIDKGLAGKLADVLGASQQFWLSRDENYRGRSRSLPFAAIDRDFRVFAQCLPIKDMKSYGWLDAFAHLPDELAALSFFQDAPGSWRQSGPGIADAVAFRTSFSHESNPASVAAWLRQGVLQARGIECSPWNPEALSQVVPRLRELTRVKDPAQFFPELVELCRAAGVAVVFVRTPKGCRASGATHFANPVKAIIQLSFRYRSDDHFWFTLFHEIGHLLLHRESLLFVEGGDYITSDEEVEADRYSASTLIPSAFWSEIEVVPRKFSAIMRLARKIGISAGVLVGQMQNRGLLRHDQMNFLKVRYDWSALEQVSP